MRRGKCSPSDQGEGQLVTAFTSSGCGRIMCSYHMLEKMDWPIFKALVLFLTAFNTSKPVPLCLWGERRAYCDSRCGFSALCCHWEWHLFCHQGLWCFVLWGVGKGGLAGLTLSHSFVYFNNDSQEYSELTALPLEVGQKFLRARNGTLSITFCVYFCGLKKEKKFLVCTWKPCLLESEIQRTV